MKIVSFTVENYRSITKAYRIHTFNKTILIGPNNEGKSNIVRALSAAMRILTQARFPRRFLGKPGSHIYPLRFRNLYDWERDYPMQLQKNKNGESTVALEFELTDIEIESFKHEIKSSLNGTLPIKISFSRNNVEVHVSKPGRGGTALSKKSNQIAHFISSNINFGHIPAVRTASHVQKIVDEMVENELSTLEELPEYQEALKKLLSCKTLS